MTEHHHCQHHNHEENNIKEEEAIKTKLESIKNKILVLSGKGGVGKSTVSVNLATSLALEGKKVGLLDIDIHGPSIPKLLNLESCPITATEDSIIPVEFMENLSVMSIGLLMQGQNEAVIWRGPMKHGIIRQFLLNVDWGNLDYLVVDSPPGTGDEPLSIAQLLANEAQAVIVTTPQEIALTDVRKSIQFCRKLTIPIMGIVENMSGFICPHCGEASDIFKSGGGEVLAKNMEVPFLGSIPIDPVIVQSSDAGKPYVVAHPDSKPAQQFKKVVKPILDLTD